MRFEVTYEKHAKEHIQAQFVTQVSIEFNNSYCMHSNITSPQTPGPALMEVCADAKMHYRGEREKCWGKSERHVHVSKC